MPDTVASVIFWALELYLAAGICFAFAFVSRGAQIIDPAVERAPLSFRLVLIPGAAALWPVLLHRWIRFERQP